MHTLTQLEKQQVGLRLPTYLVQEIDELTQGYNINRSTYITEAIKSFNKQQMEIKVQHKLEASVTEMKQMMEGKIPKTTLADLIDELEH